LGQEFLLLLHLNVDAIHIEKGMVGSNCENSKKLKNKKNLFRLMKKKKKKENLKKEKK